MRYIRDNLLLLLFCAIVGIATLDSKIVFAGGDPSIKDSKVKKQKSNIKQHDHNKLYVDKQKTLPDFLKKKIMKSKMKKRKPLYGKGKMNGS